MGSESDLDVSHSHDHCREHLSINVMNSYVVYNAQHRVVICKAHEYAISSKTAISHFRDEYDISLEKRQEIFNYISTKVVVEADQLEYSLDRVTPIPYLKIV